MDLDTDPLNVARTVSIQSDTNVATHYFPKTSNRYPYEIAVKVNGDANADYLIRIGTPLESVGSSEAVATDSDVHWFDTTTISSNKTVREQITLVEDFLQLQVTGTGSNDQAVIAVSEAHR